MATSSAQHTSRPVYLELGIEFLAEVLLFLYPYGAEQMNMPHNFWLGLSCWIFGALLAVRMFWIFPAWVPNRSTLEKVLISVLFLSALSYLLYGPVAMAYSKRNPIAQAVPIPKLVPKPSVISTPDPIKSEEPKKQRVSKPGHGVAAVPKSTITQTTGAPCSGNAIGGSVDNSNCNPPVNPNKPVITYQCNGFKRSISPGRIDVDQTIEFTVFQKLLTLQKEQKWDELLVACRSAQHEIEGWLTPYLFCSNATEKLGNHQEALLLIKAFDDTAGESPNYEGCKSALLLPTSEK
jgi:hypothetical protein